MNINRNNYEKYFIDYLEGTLSKDDIHDLRVFLLFNQDLAELLDDIAKIKLTAPSVRYTRKENLKKDELHACKDYYAIAIAENSLSTQDISDIKHSSRKQEITKQAEVYRQLKLTPDTKIRYTRKSKLYHSAYRQLGYKYSSIAAILLLILTIAITVLKSDDIHPGNRNNHGPSACDRDSCYRSGSIYKRAIFAPASLSKAGYSGTTDKNPGNDHPGITHLWNNSYFGSGSGKNPDEFSCF